MNRDCEQELREYIYRTDRPKNMLIVEGARQVSKACMIKSVLASIKDRKLISFSLEKNTLLREQNSFGGFLRAISKETSYLEQCKNFSVATIGGIYGY